MKRQFTLGAGERLKSRKKISALFRNGRKILIQPLSAYYTFEPGRGKHTTYGSGLQMGAGVSSKHFKRAVDRNRVKRLLRESYRTSNLELKELVKQKMLDMQVFFIYSGRELPKLEDIRMKMGLILQQLVKQIEKND